MNEPDPVDALEWLARIGFVVKGLLYIVIGTLSLQAAAGRRRRVAATDDALMTVLTQPFGHLLLVVAAAGLFGYALWRILQGLVDPDRLGNGWRAAALRGSYIARGALHAAFGYQVVRILRGLPSSRTSARKVAVEAFQWPFGDWFVALAGLSLIGFAVQQFYSALSGRLEANLRCSSGKPA